MDILHPNTIDQSPEAARETLGKLEKSMGFLPNLFGVMSHNPAVLEAYATLDGLIAKSGLDAKERQVVLLTASRLNECGYCMAAHTGGARSAGLDNDIIDALRDGKAIDSDDKLEALRQFTAAVVDQRGWVSDDTIKAFLDAGYEQQHVLAVILGVTMKTLSNYTNHIADTPLDDELAPMEWKQAA
ncbi:MAG: carboxymuconolactone decarboxylase family protein [Gammaproteobacteria bacterium]|nr:carboxymuconolactone decarboxylase family protein [Gammaproteobacteria bacterium]